MKNKNLITILCIIASLFCLVATITLALHMSFIIVLHYWWAFLIGMILSGSVLIFCVILYISGLLERKRKKMKARVPARQKLSKQMQASIQELVTKEREEQSKKLIEQILKVSLINLNRNFGFGQQRLIKFLDTVTEMFREHMHDELYWYHVDKILKEELKIDMEGLNELDK